MQNFVANIFYLLRSTLGLYRLQAVLAQLFTVGLLCQVDAFMRVKEEQALEFVQVLVKHQKAVFTSNPRFTETVSNAFADIKEYQNALDRHAAVVQHLADANINVAVPKPKPPAYRVAWDSYPELRVRIDRRQELTLFHVTQQQLASLQHVD